MPGGGPINDIPGTGPPTGGPAAGVAGGAAAGGFVPPAK